MGYGHADNLAGGGKEPDGSQFNGRKASDQETERSQDKRPTVSLPVPPEWYALPELEPILTGHDIGGLYRWLHTAGMSQRQIAARAGQSQSEVCELLAGRRNPIVKAYDLLVRVSCGFGIPPERMGLSWCGPNGAWHGPQGTYPGGVLVAHTPRGVLSAMLLRRHLIAYGGIVLTGALVDKVGEFLDDLGQMPTVPLPSRLGPEHVTRVREMTRRLSVGDTSYADPDLAAGAAVLATRLLAVPGTDKVKQAMRVAVAELRLEAGRAACGAGLYQHALYHYSRALELATEAGDAYCQATALHYAGFASTEDGHPDDGLKMLQAAQVAAWEIPADEPRAVVVAASGRAAVEACVLTTSAGSLTLLGQHGEAARAVAKGRDLWTPTPADPFGDIDRPGALVELHRGRLDAAHTLATASLRRWEGGRQLSRTRTGIVLAAVHVKAGERDGLQLAHDTITALSRIDSVLIRRQLTPLIDALEARPGPDAADLARKARRIAA